MNAGWKTRSAFRALTLFLICFSASAFGNWLEIKNIRTQHNLNVQYNYTKINLTAHQMVGLQFDAFFNNNSGSADFVAWLRKDRYKPIPDFIDRWENLERSVPVGAREVLSNTVFIRPTEASIDTFVVWIGEEVNGSVQNLNWVGIIINVTESPFLPPVLLDIPLFTQGSERLVSWLPAHDASQEDIFYFDDDDPVNINQAVRGMYKAPGDTVQWLFENLQDGHKYGYFVKATFQSAQGPVEIVSDIHYSVQDQSPPEDVLILQALESENQSITISWNEVDDAASGVASYVIYRAVETGRDVIQDTVMADGRQGTPYVWTDPAPVPDVVNSYRVRAIDWVGNVGDGLRSNGVRVDGSGQSEDPDPQDDPLNDPLAGQFLKGTSDTLWIELDNREAFIRFEAVRDSLAFFDRVPTGDISYFDSGWIPANWFRTQGWHSLTDVDSVYYVFNYADTGTVYFSNGLVDDRRGGEPVDQNLVNGHTYYRRFTRRYASADDTESLGWLIPDCFAPSDIENLSAISVILDPNVASPELGGTDWRFELGWDHAHDAVSGVKRYHIYRKREGIDADFMPLLLSDEFRSNRLTDTIPRDEIGTPVNPVVSYRVVAEDLAGNRRAVAATGWTSSARALWQPTAVIRDRTSPNVRYENGVLYTQEDHVIFDLSDFDKTDVLNYQVYLNDQPVEFKNRNQDFLRVDLPDGYVFDIRIRAQYLGGRTSVFTPVQRVARAANLAPRLLSAAGRIDYWKGHIYLKWARQSQDAEQFIVYRDGVVMDTVYSAQDTTDWIDYYDVDERTGEAGDILNAYQIYRYQVRQINMFSSLSEASNAIDAYCNMPPDVVSHEPPRIEGGLFVVTIHWERAQPTQIANNFTSRIRVYQDSLDHLLYEDTSGNNQLDYTARNLSAGHNYIFQVMEIPNTSTEQPSAWSKPYTVADLLSIPLFDVVPQPEGHIYVNWDNEDFFNSYQVEQFELCRDNTCWFVGRDTLEYMDDGANLTHGQTYTYLLMALDSLGQVVAANVDTATCDTGAVFIPEVSLFDHLYYNADSVDVDWQWQPRADDPRDARHLLIELSINRLFPDLPEQTVSSGWFEVDSVHRTLRLPVPDLVSSENDTLFFRIWARDGYGNPQAPVWSTAFFDMKYLIFDPIPPYSVGDMALQSMGAFYGEPDQSMVQISWSGEGVEWLPPGSQKHWTHKNSNVRGYQIVRTLDGASTQVGYITGTGGSYSYVDTALNRDYTWTVLSVDDAANVTPNTGQESAGFIPTPDAPIPVHFKACNLPEFASDYPVEYQVEIAAHPKHYRLAYELDDAALIRRILCQSDWQDSLRYECTGGWGAIVMDSTWFRMKVREIRDDGQWESAWSQYQPYALDEAERENLSGVETEGVIPEEFQIGNNYPNPFNHRTQFTFQLPREAHVRIRIFNTLGALVSVLRDEIMNAGYHTQLWDGLDREGRVVASGIYIAVVNIRSEKTALQKKMKMSLMK